MTKTQIIKRIYTVLLAVFTLAVGVAVICVVADIYYTGKGTDVIYSREIVGERLEKLAIPIVMLIAAAIAGVVFPLFEARVKPKSEDAIKKLLVRLPEGGKDEEFSAAKKSFDKYFIIRICVWSAALAVTLAGAIYTLCYLLNTANFLGEDVTAAMLNLVKCVMSFTFASLVALAVAATVNGVLAKKQLTQMKAMIKHGDGTKPYAESLAVWQKIKTAANGTAVIWTVRGIIFIAAIVFIALGVLNGGAHDVLVKAINICQECIGLG